MIQWGKEDGKDHCCIINSPKEANKQTYNQLFLVLKDNRVELVHHITVNCKQGAVSQSQAIISVITEPGNIFHRQYKNAMALFSVACLTQPSR